MASPLDAITAVHNAFRKDMTGIDAAALGAARGEQAREAELERFRYCNQVLVTHAHGEEIAVFPVLETVAPLVAEAYERDHRALDAAFDALNEAVAAGDALATARAAAAFKYFLDVHLYKEDTHLYRIFRERVSVPDQGKAVGIMAGEIPRNASPRSSPGCSRLSATTTARTCCASSRWCCHLKPSRESLSSRGKRWATTGRS